MLEADGETGAHACLADTLPFYFLEPAGGIVQRLVFMLLTAVFTDLLMWHAPTRSRGCAAH